VGLAVYVLYQPPGDLVAGALIVAGAGLMSAAWIGAIAVVVLAHKLLPRHRLIDVPLAVALVALALI
jgi:predicted metal-binding membrane protein